MSDQNRWSRFVRVCFQNASTILTHDVDQLVSHARMSEIEHDVAVHFQWRQQRWEIFEDLCTRVDRNTERWPKEEEFREISEFQRVVVHVLEQTQRHVEIFFFNSRVLEIVVQQEIRAGFRRERRDENSEIRWVKIWIDQIVRKEHVLKIEILKVGRREHDEQKNEKMWKEKQYTLSSEIDAQLFLHFFDFQLTTKISMILFQILNFCRFRTWSSNLRLIECVVVVYVDEFEIVVNVEIVEILDLIFEMFRRREDFATKIDELLRKRTFRDEARACIFVNSNTIFYFECDSFASNLFEFECIVVTAFFDDSDIVFVWNEIEFDVHIATTKRQWNRVLIKSNEILHQKVCENRRIEICYIKNWCKNLYNWLLQIFAKEETKDEKWNRWDIDFLFN